MTPESKKQLQRGITLTIVGLVLALPILAVLSSLFGRTNNSFVLALPFAIILPAIGIYFLSRFFVLRSRDRQSASSGIAD